MGSGDASCEAGAHRLEWRPISRKSNISCCVGSGDSFFDAGAHRLEWRRRCVASADAADKETLRQAVQRGQDQLRYRLRQAQQPQQGTSSSGVVHQQAQQLRAAGCAEVEKQSAPAAAAAAAAADASSVEAAAPAPAADSSRVEAVAPAPAWVTVAAGTPRSIHELTASNGDVDAEHQQMQREATLRQAVQRGQNQLRCRPRRRSGRGKDTRVAVLLLSRHSSCRGVIEFRRASFVVDFSGLWRVPITWRVIGNSSMRSQWATLSTGCARGHHLKRQGLRSNPFRKEA